MLACLIPVFGSGRSSQQTSLTILWAGMAVLVAQGAPLRRRVDWLVARRGPAAGGSAASLLDAFKKAHADARATRTTVCLFFVLVVARALLTEATAPWHGAALVVSPLLAACAAAQTVLELRRVRAGAPGRPRPPRLDRVFS
jgi:hypothetical protein